MRVTVKYLITQLQMSSKKVQVHWIMFFLFWYTIAFISNMLKIFGKIVIWNDVLHLGNCHHNSFECKNLKCIPKHYLCDFSDDCSDNSDEENCGKVQILRFSAIFLFIRQILLISLNKIRFDIYEFW